MVEKISVEVAWGVWFAEERGSDDRLYRKLKLALGLIILVFRLLIVVKISWVAGSCNSLSMIHVFCVCMTLAYMFIFLTFFEYQVLYLPIRIHICIYLCTSIMIIAYIKYTYMHMLY